MNFTTVWKAWLYNLYNMKYQKHKKEKHKHYIHEIAIDTIYPNCWTGYSSPSCYSVWSCLSTVPCLKHSLQLCISLTSDIHTCLCEVAVHSPLFFGIPWILSLSTFNSRPPHLTSCPTKKDFCNFLNSYLFPPNVFKNVSICSIILPVYSLLYILQKHYIL